MIARSLLLMFFVLQVTAHASLLDKWQELKESIKPAEIEQKIREEVTKLDIGFNLDLLDLELFNAAGLAARYRYEVEPSYREDWYTRVDKWQITASLRPGDLLPEYQISLGFKVEQGAEMVFVRQFKSQKDALKALPYSPKHLPISSERALRQLSPGDFAAIPARLNLILSADVGASSGIFSGSLHTHYLLSGEFLIQVFRLKDERVRVRLVALRKRATNGSASASMDFKIFGISVVDKQIKKFIDMNLAQFGITKEQGNLFLLDYIFDLKNGEARTAYDTLLSGSLRFKNADVLNPFLSQQELHDTVLSDLALAEALHEQDLEKDSSKRRVDRIFKGQNDFTSTSSRLKLGINLARFENRKAYTENRMAWFGRDGLRQDFLFPIYSREKKRSFLFGLFKSQQVESHFALFELNEGQQIKDFSDYGYSFEYKDKTLFSSEMKQLREGLQILLPEVLWPDFHDWSQESKRDNARARLEVFFHREAVAHLEGLTVDQLYLGLARYVKRLPELTLPSHGEGEPQRPAPGWKWSAAKKEALAAVLARNYDRYWYSMIKMVERLEQVFSPSGADGYMARVQKLFDLRKNSAFEEVGTGYLISLLPETSLSNLVYVAANWTASGMKPFAFKFGTHKNSTLYDELMHVQRVLNDRGFDPGSYDDFFVDEQEAKRSHLFEELYDLD